MSLPVFFHSFFVNPALMPSIPTVPQPPPPSRLNTSWRWTFWTVRQVSHQHHLPRIQTRAGGGFFRLFNDSATTSLASKREPEVDFLVLSMCLPPLPPSSHPNASWRWFSWSFLHLCHDDHLPRIQTQAGGGLFSIFHTSAMMTTSLASKRELEVVSFGSFDPSAPFSTSLASKRELGVDFRAFQHVCHQHHLPRIQTRAGGGFFGCFNLPPTTTTSLVSNTSRRWIFQTFQHVSHHCHLPRVQM